MKRILVVDDERDIRETLRDVFLDEGYEVDVAADGVEALAALRENGPYALVLFDILMPKMDGNALFRAIKSDPRLANMPLIVSTSNPASAPSGVLLMRKPIDLNTLINTIHHLCR
jgi:two-component system response regulator MprA